MNAPATMIDPPPNLDPRLFDGLCVYQDICIDGRRVVQGVRDCEGRWQALLPHLPGGVLLDIGSNFGWFGQRWRETFADSQVVSIEADERSARVQRAVLAANRQEHLYLLTARAQAKLMHCFERHAQRFDAVLLLSILHWIPGHRELMTALGRIAGRIFVEQPDPSETGAGDARLRGEIGPIGAYLRTLFPTRRVRELARWPSHRPSEQPRQLWLVEEPLGWQPTEGRVELPALLKGEPAWPPRSWWLEQPSLAACRSQVRRLPEGDLFTVSGRWRRRVLRLLSVLGSAR